MKSLPPSLSILLRIVLAILRFPLVRMVIVTVAALLIGLPVGFALNWLFPGISLEAGEGAESTISQTGSYAVVYGVIVASMLGSRWIVERLLMGRRRMDEYALARALPETAAGFGIGVALIAVVAATMWVAGWYSVVGTEFGAPAEVARLVALSLVVFAVVAAMEEVMFRGIGFLYVEEALGTIPALVISGLAFGFIHAGNDNSTLRSSVFIAITAGPMLGLLYVVTRRMWLPIGLHWAWNFTMGPILGLSVSGMEFGAKEESIVRASVTGPEAWTGGAFGPEAGWPIVIVGTALSAALFRIAWRRGEIRLVPAWWGFWREGTAVPQSSNPDGPTQQAPLPGSAADHV